MKMSIDGLTIIVYLRLNTLTHHIVDVIERIHIDTVQVYNSLLSGYASVLIAHH